VPKPRNPKPEKVAEVESARKELQNADMGAFDRAMRALLKTTDGKHGQAHKRTKK
jgi:hypothetical protein